MQDDVCIYNKNDLTYWLYSILYYMDILFLRLSGFLGAEISEVLQEYIRKGGSIVSSFHMLDEVNILQIMVCQDIPSAILLTVFFDVTYPLLGESLTDLGIEYRQGCTESRLTLDLAALVFGLVYLQ